MGRSDLPDMYARALGRAVPKSECRHIRQITTAYVTYVMQHFRAAKNCPNLLVSALVVYLVTGSHFEYGFMFFYVVVTSIYMKWHGTFDCGIVTM